MRYYPVLLDVRGRCCVVVGGGKVAERKVVALIDAGADLAVVSLELTPFLTELASRGTIAHRSKSFDERDLAGAYLVIAATNDASVNENVARTCRKAGILVNAATSPGEGTFVVPSVVVRGDMLIAISTCGSSPALSRKVRQDLEHAFGPEYAVFLEKMGLLRRKLLRVLPDEHIRRKVFQALVDSDVLELLRSGKDHDADTRILQVVKTITG